MANCSLPSSALEFDPDRFLDARLKYLTSNPFIFLPFNAGPRICLGQQVRRILPSLFFGILILASLCAVRLQRSLVLPCPTFTAFLDDFSSSRGSASFLQTSRKVGEGRRDHGERKDTS